MRKIVFLLFMLTAMFRAWAGEEVVLKADAPDVVVSGDQFRLTFTVNTHDVKDFRASTAKGFDVLMGPSRQQSSSTQIINGKVSSSKSITYTYILMAGEAGTYTIPAASVEVDHKKIFSNSLTIKVLPPDKEAVADANNSANGSSSRNQAAGSRISNKDLFITTTASKTKVYEQEAILLTYKAYTTVDLRQLIGKMSDQQGFYIQEVELPQQSWSLEHYKGRNYNTAVYRQYVLFPQKTGKITIPEVTFDAVVAQRIEISGDPFDAFFNGGGYTQVQKKIVAPKVVLNVESLPTKPENYSGAVGDFKLNANISATALKANDAVTIKLNISGTGNMKLISTPEVKFPQDFEVYDPKVTDNYQLTANGLSGTKSIEYLAIPRHAGNFTIPPIEFSYFDLKTKAYKTLKTEAYTLNVAKGEGSGSSQVISNFTNKEDVKVLGKDIRFIKMGETSLSEKGKYLFGTTTYYLCYLIPFLLFVVFVAVYRKQAVENANIAKMKTKKANKVATKRMKLAGKLLAENKKNEFYDEVLKALWGYISDKLSIPVSKLSKDNIEFELSRYGVSEELTKDFINALNECEFARYAPGNENEAMDKVYSSSINVISKMENSIKH